jgi:hypothetical protein
LQWLSVVILSGLSYYPLSRFLLQYTKMKELQAVLACYVVVALVTMLLFSFFRRKVGEKLTGSETFGKLEYGLGMLAGVLRYLCIVLFLISMLNAKYIGDTELRRMAKVQKDNFGDISFPTVGSLQQAVFIESFSGGYIVRYLGSQLIHPVGKK